MTPLQTYTLVLVARLDEARRELSVEQYEWLLDILATRIARDVVKAALNERRAA